MKDFLAKRQEKIETKKKRRLHGMFALTYKLKAMSPKGQKKDQDRSRPTKDREKEQDDQLIQVIKKELLEVLDQAFLGPKKWIYCYRTLDEGVPARMFLEHMIPTEAQASYAKQFQFHCQGHHVRGEKWRPWKDKGCDGLCEYKDNPSQSRLLHITERGHIHILLFGFTGKKEDKVDKKHIERGKRLRDEYLERRSKIEKRLKGKK